MKFSLIFIFCLGVFFVNAQEGSFLLSIKDYPVKEGSIFYTIETVSRCYRLPIEGVEVISKSDSVFSIANGIITDVFQIDDQWGVFVKNSTGLFYVYWHLQKPILEKGIIITKGTFLGKIKRNDEDILSIRLMISDRKGKIFNQLKTVELLKKILPQNCNYKPQEIVAL